MDVAKQVNGIPFLKLRTGFYITRQSSSIPKVKGIPRTTWHTIKLEQC